MEPLQLESANFCRRADNAKESHTEEYQIDHWRSDDGNDCPAAVFRRESNFYFTIKFNRNFNDKDDIVKICFDFGDKPNVLKGTRVILPLSPTDKEMSKDTNKWEIVMSHPDGNEITLLVHIPPNVQVGIWTCNIQTKIKDQPNINDRKANIIIIILFNPWCKDDGVYMENEDERKEYVLNENGKIWHGTHNNPTSRRWIFGQFGAFALQASLLLLDKAGLEPVNRGSPILVTRAISAAVNAQGENGLLQGRWDGCYNDGTAPNAWTGSGAIMDEFFNKGGQPVRYGQCSVFSAATVTVCRALGIPCRSITNYVSAHDSDNTLSIDKFYDINGHEIEHGPDGNCHDSIWNFHVWNEVWMSRPDLPSGYGGWQVIDATPHQCSDGIIDTIGPASVEAVKRGKVGYLYDTQFVLSEVNADVCSFQANKHSDWGFSRISADQSYVGRRIVTKAANIDDDQGNSDLCDITHLYKQKEGSALERLQVYNAVKGVPKARQYYEFSCKCKNEEDVVFNLMNIDVTQFGESFDVVMNITNKSSDTRNITIVLHAASVYYNGVKAKDIKTKQENCVVKAGETRTLKMPVTKEEYLSKLVDHGFIKMHSLAKVKETNQTWSGEDDFIFTKPNLDINVNGDFQIGNNTKVDFSIRNPLKQLPLTDCKVTIDGPGLEKPKVIPVNVGPNETFNFSEIFCPNRRGKGSIVANFNSSEIQGINGGRIVQIL